MEIFEFTTRLYDKPNYTNNILFESIIISNKFTKQYKLYELNARNINKSCNCLLLKFNNESLFINVFNESFWIDSGQYIFICKKIMYYENKLFLLKFVALDSIIQKKIKAKNWCIVTSYNYMDELCESAFCSRYNSIIEDRIVDLHVSPQPEFCFEFVNNRLHTNPPIFNIPNIDVVFDKLNDFIPNPIYQYNIPFTKNTDVNTYINYYLSFNHTHSDVDHGIRVFNTAINPLILRLITLYNIKNVERMILNLMTDKKNVNLILEFIASQELIHAL